MVYEVDDYASDSSKYFRGFSDGRVNVERNDELPVGTYYYVLEYTLTTGVVKKRSGFLCLNR